MMGSYNNRSHIKPEASAGASVPHFSWFYSGSFYSSPRTSSVHPHGAPINEPTVLPATPIRSVPPPTEPVKDNNSGSKPSKPKKQKSSIKVSNRTPSKTSKPKQPKKTPLKKKGQSMPEAKREKRNLDVDVDITGFDLSGVPSPFCSCTGTHRFCYKWGAGGWQSSCCTTNISEYPLPTSATRPGARLAGRKMSNGAYLKLLMKLAADGLDLSHPLDLKDHWARHGTNKFVTIK